MVLNAVKNELVCGYIIEVHSGRMSLFYPIDTLDLSGLNDGQ